MKLTALVIARDEASVLGRCLGSLLYTPVEGDVEYPRRPIWDELIVVDTGSSDDTCEIAKSFGAKIAHFDWVNDFSAARNFAESLATGEYIFWIDADEELVSGHAAIRALVETGREISVRPVVDVLYKGQLAGKPYPRQDLIHKAGSHVWVRAQHEQMEGPAGRVEQSIRYHEIPRPEGDKPHSWDALRAAAQEQTDEAYFYLAAAHGAKEHYVEALALIDKLLGLPGPTSLTRARAAWQKGHILRVCGDMNGAMGAYLEGIRQFPILAEPFYYLGEMFLANNIPSLAYVWLSAACVMGQSEHAYDLAIYDDRHEKLKEAEARCRPTITAAAAAA